jgi:hypothetical protein
MTCPSTIRSWLLISLIAFAAACDKRYEALTAPPPGLTASLNDHDKTIEISPGVSLGFECFDDRDNPCAREASGGDPATAWIYPAALDTVTERAAVSGPQTRSAFVVVGIAAGKTEVSAGGGSLTVTVLPSSAPPR